LGIITVLIFGDYYVAFWGLLLSSISGIIQATRQQRTIWMEQLNFIQDCRVTMNQFCLYRCHAPW
jgi:hypothetical protein